ncbi:MAG TPA: CRISPR-associated endonuclease Cas1 [Campylobacteraceae bacterium]|nr:CRISPR-associated endonuclease Cas1 [Campylobacteraceae bacterium]HHD84324.1 CRISPR-associated endonuclease Cas1 [Campylobacteraceae bacterium]
MNLTVIDRKEACIKTDNKTLVVDTQKIPFHLIDTLLIVGRQQLSTADITLLAAHETAVILLSANFTQSALVTPTAPKNAELKLAQYRAAATDPLPVAKWLLTLKIKSHIAQLNNHNIAIDEAPLQEKIDAAEDLDTLLGLEGSFSRRYFGHYFTLFPKTLHKGKRSKRPPLDPLNAMLSWYYTLLYHIIAVRLIGFGFETGIGFLHRPFRSHMALASDLLELFRADINAYVYRIFADKVVTNGDFSKKRGVYLRYEGRKKLYKPFREFLSTLEPRIDAAISELRSRL